MKLLLNAGNVKGKIISGLKNVFRKNCRHFILLLAGKNDLYLAEIICIKEQKMYKVMASVHEKKRLDDEFFYQEALYHFCRDRNLSKLPVFISLDKEMVVIKQFDFPKMPLNDVKKAVAWELNDWQKEYSYNYRLEMDGEFCHIRAALVAKKYLNDWRQIINEQNLETAEFFVTDELSAAAKDFIMDIADEEILTDEAERIRLKRVLYCISARQEIVLGDWQLTHLNWRNINILLLVSLIICSSFTAGFYLYDYCQTKEQQQILREQLDLKHDDKIWIEEFKEQENTIKNKQEKLKQVYKNDALLYPLLVNLSTRNTDGVKLVSVSVKEKQAQLKGKAVSYEALSDYKARLAEIKFIRNVKVDNTKLNEADNLIDFNIYFDEVRENE